MKNLWEGIKKIWKGLKYIWKSMKEILGIDSGSRMLTWSLLIFGIFCFLLSIYHYDVNNGNNAFTYLGGFAIAIWMLRYFGADKGYRITIETASALLWVLIFLVSFKLMVPLLYWSAGYALLSLTDKIRSFIALGVFSVALYMIIHSICKLLKRIIDSIHSIIKKSAGQSQDSSGEKKTGAFLDTIIAIIVYVIPCISTIFTVLSYFR